jgi:hypothetical protein
MPARNCAANFAVFWFPFLAKWELDMSYKTLAAVVISAMALSGCQTMQQVAQARTKVVCFQAGYGETSPHHGECMRAMLPVAMNLEAERRLDDVRTGLAQIASGLQRR